MFIGYYFFTLFLFIVRYGWTERLTHITHSGVLVILGFHKEYNYNYDTLKNKSYLILRIYRITLTLVLNCLEVQD